MDQKEYNLMYETEETHWWFKGKRVVVFNQLELFLHNKKRLKILDIGCGTGIIMRHLQQYGTVFGIDVEKTAINFCVKRGVKNIVQASATHLPFKNNRFDVVSIFDLLYHQGVEDDVKVMKEAFRVLRPGALLVITDAADMRLSSKHDIAMHVRERYSILKLLNRVTAARFKVVKISYFNTFLYPAVFFVRKLDNLLVKGSAPYSNIKKTNPILNKLLFSILCLESQMLKKINFPFGVSILAIAKKDSKNHKLQLN